MLLPSDLTRLATTLGGLPVLGCISGSPADEAGMRYGDILLAVNGFPTATWDDFLRARAHSDGTLLARIFRQGVEFDVSLPLRKSTASPMEIVAELQIRGIMPGDINSDA